MKSKQSGFALIQIMIAMAILAMVSVMAWAALQQTNRAKKNGERNVEQYKSGRQAVNQLVKDISMAYLSSNQAPGLDLTPRTFFEGVKKSDIDELRFTNMGHLRIDQDAKQSDTAVVAYFARPDPDPKKAGKLQLIRFQSKYLQPVNPSLAETILPGEIDILCDQVARLEIWYYAPEQKKWVDTWRTTQLDSFPNQLPSRVRFKLVLYTDDRKELSFVSEVRVSMFQTLDTSPK